MKLSVVIPVYNEIKTIRHVVEQVKVSPVNKLEIVIVDDCSTDGTIIKLKNEIAPLVDKIIYHKKNRGKGAALRTGFKHVTGDFVIVQDADLEYDPADYKIMLSPVLNHNADVVYGSRFLGGSEHRVLFFWHYLGNRFLTFLSNIFTDLNLTDMETCYKLFRREIIQSINIKENRFGVEPEITAKIAQMNCKIYEVGISYHGRTYAEGKKIGWKDGIRAIIVILKYGLLNILHKIKNK